MEFKHIYREINTLDDELAKARTTMHERFWNIIEHHFSEITETNILF